MGIGHYGFGPTKGLKAHPHDVSEQPYNPQIPNPILHAVHDHSPSCTTRVRRKAGTKKALVPLRSVTQYEP